VVINWASEVGSAYAAGLSDGDVVTAIDGEAASSPAVLNAIIARHRVGDVVRVEVLQKGVVPSTVSVGLKGLPRYNMDTFESARLPVTDVMRGFRARWLSSQIAQ
jgi:S1-C subfamily serine protease